MNARFVKVVPAERAAAEVAGWQAVRDVFRVPKLLGWYCHPGYDTVVYEDVFANGQCEHLLGDCITLADHGLTGIGPVRELIDGICADLERSTSRSGARNPLADCVPALYADRLHPAGRLDTWYAADSGLTVGSAEITLAELAAFDLVVNGSRYRLDIADVIEQVRRDLHRNSRWMTAITQGDPTEPNIAYPTTWLDFEHAGRNVVAGEVANLLWYLLGMGGWLVPKHQPAVYQRTLRHRLPSVITPTAAHLEVSVEHHRIEVVTRWDVGPGRAAAIETLVAALHRRLGDACAAGRSDILAALRPFLITRMLGVIRLGTLDGTDTVLCLAKLAQLHDPQTTLSDLLLDLAVSEVSR